MRTSKPQDSGIRVDMTAWPIPALIDRVLFKYVDWHETTDVVIDTYRRWCAAPAVDEATCFATYMAALDQEQTAAATYAASIEELKRWIPDSD